MGTVLFAGNLCRRCAIERGVREVSTSHEYSFDMFCHLYLPCHRSAVYVEVVSIEHKQVVLETDVVLGGYPPIAHWEVCNQKLARFLRGNTPAKTPHQQIKAYFPRQRHVRYKNHISYSEGPSKRIGMMREIYSSSLTGLIRTGFNSPINSIAKDSL